MYYLYISKTQNQRRFKIYYKHNHRIWASDSRIRQINHQIIINQLQILNQETVKMQAQNNTQRIQPDRSQRIEERQIPKDQIAMMEQKQVDNKLIDRDEADNSVKLDSKYREKLSKELEVPKDEIQLMKEREQSKKIQPEIIRIKQFIQQRKQQNEKCQNKECDQKNLGKSENQERLSGKCEQKLSPIREEKPAEQCKDSSDLLNFDVEPIRIQPKIQSRDSQKELMKQMFEPRHCEVERKEQLTPRTADKIMKQIHDDEMKDESERSQIQRKADVRKKQSEPIQIKERDQKKDNERKTKKIVKEAKQQKKGHVNKESKHADRLQAEQIRKPNKQNQMKAA